MTNHVRISALVAVAAVATVVAITAHHLAGQAPATPRAINQFPQGFKGPRMPDGNPDLNGVWQQFTTAAWDIQDHPAAAGPHPEVMGVYGAEPAGLGIVEGNEIPYQPWALAKKKENFERRLTADPFNLEIGDPGAKCYIAGVPRATYEPFPFRIIQSTNNIMFVYEYANVARLIHFGRMPPPPVDSWMGQSVGHFEGETFVVTATGFNDRTWFDRAGNFHSEALTVTERYTPVSPYHLAYEATIVDSKVFTRPWKISFPLYRRMERNADVLEFSCVEFVEPFLYGSLVKRNQAAGVPER
jgi:hypothetical protein